VKRLILRNERVPNASIAVSVPRVTILSVVGVLLLQFYLLFFHYAVVGFVVDYWVYYGELLANEIEYPQVNCIFVNNCISIFLKGTCKSCKF